MKFLKIGAMLLLLGLTATAVAQTASPGAESSSSAEGARELTIPYSKIFTFFLVMLGPIKLLGPFVKITKGMDDATSRRLALKGFVIACLAGLVAALLGQNLLFKWGVSLPALLLAGGLILLLIALKTVLSQYEPHAAPSAETEEAEVTTLRKGLAFSPLAFPSIITPFGTAALILMLGASDKSRDFNILGIFLLVMILNLIAMWFARPILKHGSGVLGVLGAVLGVLQVALAIQMIMAAARLLGVPMPHSL